MNSNYLLATKILKIIFFKYLIGSPLKRGFLKTAHVVPFACMKFKAQKQDRSYIQSHEDS